MRSLNNILLLAACLLAPLIACAADEPVPVAALPDCLREAEQNPKMGYQAAIDWEDRGSGGNNARLCQAMALFHHGEFEAAAKRLDELAPNYAPHDQARTAHMLAQAGWAWLRAGQNETAEADYTAALAHLPDDLELHVDRAIAEAGARHYGAAAQDLTAVLTQNPDRTDALLYRAEAYRALGNFDGALKDADRALQTSPDNAEALLLRGNIHAQSGNPKAAEADWLKAAALVPADSETGTAAEDNLRRLDRVGDNEQEKQ
jgi:tetratricopeptide (TPR) repeat protein